MVNRAWIKLIKVFVMDCAKDNKLVGLYVGVVGVWLNEHKKND